MPFLHGQAKVSALYNSIVGTFEHILKIQRKFYNLIVTCEGQVEVLVNYWDKLIGEIQKMVKLEKKEANKVAVNSLIIRIIKVPHHVRHAALLEYVKGCR